MVLNASAHNAHVSLRHAFIQLLPDLRRLLGHYFRYEKPEQRSESASEAIAFAFAMFKSAFEAGKQVDVRPLARYAALTVKSGARFSGTRRLDATNCQTRGGQGVRRCSSLEETPESVVTDRKGHWPVSDQVAFRMDWTAFANRCSRKERLIMNRLAAGYRRNEVAEELDVTPPAITLRMNQLHRRWCAFRG